MTRVHCARSKRMPSGNLACRQNGKLYGFPKDLYSWDQPDTRWVLGLQWLATVMYPERLKPETLMPAVQEFYQFAYGLDAQAFEASIKPALQGDLP